MKRDSGDVLHRVAALDWERIATELAANVELGDPDHKTLYIAARTGVYRIRVNVAGIP